LFCKQKANRRPAVLQQALTASWSYIRGAVFTHLLLFLSLTALAAAQTTPWTARLRGSWTATAAGAGDVTLAARDTTAQIVVGAVESSAVRQAAEFLAADIAKISGHRPPIVASPEPDNSAIRLVTLGNGEVPAAVNAGTLQGQWESYRIVTAGRDVWLVGSNPRGTAFAAYALSERLGADPLYLWTGYTPEHRDPRILKSTNFAQGPPAFRYRGLFHDDEDLLPRPFDANGYPLQTGDVPIEWYRRFFETALRLRMNMVAPYTRVHRRFEVQKLASDWGLYYTSHHYDILVSNPFGLERFNLAAERGVKPVWDWFTNRDGMLAFWRGGVMENRSLDVIWPVGMRGTQDRPFSFPDGTTDEQKAATFREVIARQVAMVRELLPEDKTPLFHFTMYNEMLPQYQRDPAAFDLPADVMIVWPDDNDGHMRGLPGGLGKWKHGVYYHLAYLGGRLTKQLTHTVGPEVVAGQFDRIVKAGATEYMLVNVSEVRDYVMGTRMIADITWDAPAIYASADASSRFTGWWSREYFPSAAEAARSAYARYFAALDSPEKLWTASDAVQDLIDRLGKKAANESYEPFSGETRSLLQSQRRQLEDALAAASRASGALPMSEQRFFSIDVVLGLETALRHTQAALQLGEALRAPDLKRMWPPVFEARAALEQLETVLARGEYPPFDRWYQESWIRGAGSQSNPHRPYIEVRAFIAREGRGAANR
jgi:hypothetical protein